MFIVITNDRHSDPQAKPFTHRDAAIAYAEREVEDNARHPEDSGKWDRELNESMIADGWVWYCQYSVEGDSVWVVQTGLGDAT